MAKRKPARLDPREVEAVALVLLKRRGFQFLVGRRDGGDEDVATYLKAMADARAAIRALDKAREKRDD